MSLNGSSTGVLHNCIENKTQKCRSMSHHIIALRFKNSSLCFPTTTTTMWHTIPNFLLFFFFTLTLHTWTFPKHTYSENDEDEGTDGSNKRNLCVATTAC